ncbi:MAG: CHAT domain-containing protein [Rhodocyclaceae bacterium]|jgi:hypothetical protein|nr:MAG: CHAT domain-containing protein [Rhodocyclaceae bacterium]
MSLVIAIATADTSWFTVLRGYLLTSGVDEAALPSRPLTSGTAVGNWLMDGTPGLLVLDAGIPVEQRRRRDDGSTLAARDILERLNGSSAAVLVVTSSPSAASALESICAELDNALILPVEKLQRHRENILRPFLAILTDSTGSNTFGSSFRIVEAELQSNKVEVRLGVGGGAPMLDWNTVMNLDDLKQAARLYDTVEDPFASIHQGVWPGVQPPKNWLETLRVVGRTLFRVLVVDAVGSHLFSKIESAAGGLEGMSFRFVINHSGFFSAPFEASVRYLQSEEEGPFVLLYAPLVRQVPLPVRLRMAPRKALVPPGATVLFVRSQMGEFPNAPRKWMNYEGIAFDKLGNVDRELQHLQDLEEAGRIQLEVANLSEAAPGKAAEMLLDTVNKIKPIVLHYAGHAWSDGRNTATLILPGATPDEAMGLKLDRIAAYEGLSDTKLVYLSACRGITKGSVQQMVMHGIPYALGFRWSVEDSRAPEFAKAFYEELCRRHSVPHAFRRACRASWERLGRDDESPIWISPILLAQAADWAAHDDPPSCPSEVLLTA